MFRKPYDDKQYSDNISRKPKNFLNQRPSAAHGSFDGPSSCLQRCRWSLICRNPIRGLIILAVLTVLIPGWVRFAGAAEATGKSELTATQAIILGIVEGVTEYLPVSSTGHLLMAKEIMRLGQGTEQGAGATGDANTAINAYIVVIQFGAILAILVICLNRFKAIYRGLFYGDPKGRKLLTHLLYAFLPAVIIGLALEKQIKSYLFGTYPVIIGWVAGGFVILIFSFLCRRRAIDLHRGKTIEDITIRMALLIGIAQCFAMWPGVSRSLATILGALFLGLSMKAAVEFSFLLGAITLSAATGYDLLKHGSEMMRVFDFSSMVLGLVLAFAAAVLSVKWMVRYLNRYGLELFGYYRIAIAGVAYVLFFT